MVTFLKLLLKQGLMGPPTPSYSVQKHINSPHLSTQSVPDSQTALPQARSIWRSCSATPFHGRNTGFASGRVGEQFRMCWFHSLVCPNRNNRRTTANCHLYRSSPSVCRLGRSRSSGFLATFFVFVDVVLIGETACVPHTPYVRTEGFVQATAYLWLPASNRSMQIYPKF